MSDDGVRVWLDRELSEQLKQAAAAKGLSARALMERMVAEGLKTELGRQAKVAGMKADSQLTRIDRIVGELEHAHGRVDHLLEEIGTRIPQQLKKEFDSLKTHVSNTGGTAHLRDLLKQLMDEFQRAMVVKLEEVKHAARQVEEHRTTHKTLHAMWTQQIRVRWAAAAGAAGAVLLLLASSFLLADTPPTRWMAVRLTGRTEPLMAGYALIGNGWIAGETLLKTNQMLQRHDEFADSLDGCFREAEGRLEGFSCTISIPPMPPTPMQPAS